VAEAVQSRSCGSAQAIAFVWSQAISVRLLLSVIEPDHQATAAISRQLHSQDSMKDGNQGFRAALPFAKWCWVDVQGMAAMALCYRGCNDRNAMRKHAVQQCLELCKKGLGGVSI
jgi:hypothetical protein